MRRLIHHLQYWVSKFYGTIAISLVVLCFWLSCFWLSIAQATPPDLAAQELQDQRYQTAVTKLEQLLKQPSNDDQRPAIGHRLYQIQLLSNLGIAYKNLGQYAESADRHRSAGQQMMQLIKETNNDRDRQIYRQTLAQILLNLGTTQDALGNYDRALKAYQQTLRLARETNDINLQSRALSNLGALHSTLGEDDRAIDYLQKALKVSQTENNLTNQIPIILNLATIHHIRNELNLAKPLYDQALQNARSLKNQSLETQILTNLGLLYEDLKEYETAIVTHKTAISLATRLNAPELLATSLNNYGHTLHVMKRFDEAETVLRKSIELLDRLRLNLDDKYNISKQDTQLNTYGLLQEVLVDANKPEAALEIAEQGRARAFAELLAHRQTQKTFRKLDTITLNQIRNIAKKQNATLIEYAIVTDAEFKFRGKQRGKVESLLIWVVQPDGKIMLRRVDMVANRKKQGTLDQTISIARCLSSSCPSLSELFDFPFPEFPKNSPKSLTYPALPELYQTLIHPIQDLLPKNPNARIIIIPQADLFLVPFAALPDRNGKYLIEKHTLSYAPSIQILDLLDRSPQHPNTPTPQHPLILGNPSPMPEKLATLPHSETEAIAIANLFKTSPILGKQATRTNIVPKLENASLIHLATHGLLSYGQLESIDTPGAIAFAPSDQSNGILTANDIFNLSIKADMVVLSACDTGRGTLTGDGVLGLSRSWLVAGTPSVIVSLWAVNDKSTADLMVAFYQELQTQKDRAIALRKAMLTTMKQYPKPKDWAAFTLVGR